MTELEGRRVLVTGAGSGVGADIAVTFARKGARVAICGRRLEALNAVADQFATIHAFEADVSDESSVSNLYAALGEAALTPDIVIANAGIAESAPFSRTSLAAWQKDDRNQS